MLLQCRLRNGLKRQLLVALFQKQDAMVEHMPIGRWGNGDVELFMEHQDELDQIMEIVKQSFDAQAE